jgi:hypothetical protein
MGKMNNAVALLPALVPALLLAACGSGHDAGAPAVTVTELAAGVHAVSTGDAADPVEGKYYAAADGSRLLVLNDREQRAGALYRRDAGGRWQASPAVTADTAVDLAGGTALSSTVLSAASVAGRYAIGLAGGATASFTVTTGGDILPGDTACKLAGKVAMSALPNALQLALTASGCAGLPARADGYLVVDGDYAPAAFRLLGPGAGTPLDLWAYAQ